ncbi:MAG: chromosome segregation protein SMC [Thermoplasmatota archaeon]
MHLKEVHVENFKSFGRKLTIPFEEGFTGITGPNGSGKSNIGDAILFVLGPNSPRAIRAGRLTDLIFNGGAGGKPAKYTLVALTFDNRDRMMPVDADDVVLTRKVVRKPKPDDPDAYSGYFYVNGRASKKKEFVDLLNHARISADGYNITQQGDVLRICQMTNVERRRILDDIAGVTAFDKDIDQADRRKAEVEANLERIGIVLDEIARNLKQLEKDKESAARYQQLQADIGRTKGLVAHRRRTDVEAQVAQVHAQIDQFTQERAKLDEQLQGLQARYKETQADFAEAEQKIREEGGEEARALQEKLEEVRDRMVRLEEKVNFAKMELEGGSEDLAPLQEELRRVQKEAERTRKLHGEAETAAASAAETLAARAKELEGVQDLISRSNEGAMALKQELAKLRQEHEAKQLELHEAKLEADRLADRVEEATTRSGGAASDVEVAEQDLKEAEWHLKEMGEGEEGAGGSGGRSRASAQKRLFALRKRLAELSTENEELEQRIRRQQRELAELQARRDAAERVKGGFGAAVEAVLAARESGALRGVIGTIAELANADAQYQTALQTAAGGRMQAVVVEDDAAAAACIEFLKERRAGRATFLPLTKMVPGRPRGQALMKVKQEGCLGFALDLIDFNPRYQNAFWYVFGDTLVAANMNAGRRMMGGVRIVTTDGELFEASGAMVGGSQGKRGAGPSFSNQDRGRVDELLQSLQQSEAAQADVEAQISTTRGELAEIEDELADAGRDDAALEAKRAQLRSRRDSLTKQLESLREAAAGWQTKQQEAREAQAAQVERQQDLADRLEELERLRDEKGQLLLKGTKKELREKVESLQAEIESLKDARRDAESRRDVACKQLELVEARAAELGRQIDGHDEEMERHRVDVERYGQAHQKARAELEALMKMEAKASGALKKLQEARDKAYQKLVDLKAKMDGVADRRETHFSLITKAKAKLPALEEELAEALIELKEHPIELADDEEVPPLADLRRTLRNLEGQLERLGPVNMRALEEYDAQAARQTELKEEVARLEDQRTELVKLVERITQKKKGALLEVFTAINENFVQVYARLSMGGQARMELEDPDDPFAGGLILKAQPPGKRVLRLDALSGGEKSLTSMAFIFAIQQHEPSPFYYLDEVDQNLDAVNSELLAKLVRDNAQFAQFIQVSLRKITLKEAHRLYGVTQPIPGQSEVIADFGLDQVQEAEPEDDDEAAENQGADAPVHGDDDSIEGTLKSMMLAEVRE